MIKTSLIVLATLMASTSVYAQAPAAAPPPTRAKGPAVALAVEAAQSALSDCMSKTYKVTALVVDSAGVPVAMMSQDGAAARTQDIAKSKIATVMKYKVASGVIVERAKTDTALADALKADPAIGQARQGALPIMVMGEMIGAMAVSGAPGGDKDEACVMTGLAKVQARLM
ncbi:MAG: heme-binding protein [Alphaproteobacteria bacterium]